MTQPNLYEVQRQLEQEATDIGVAYYREAAREEGLDGLKPGVALLKRHIKPVAERITAFVEAAEAGRAGKSASIAYFLAQFDADVAAFMALKKIIGGLAQRVPLTRMASSIGTYFEDAVNFRQLEKEAPGLYRQLQRRIATRKDAGVRHLILRRQSKYAGLKTVTWDQSSKVKLGLRLIDFVAETGLIQIQQIARGAKDTPYYVLATPATFAWLEDAHARCEVLSPMYMPMVVQPKAWTTPFNGGYLEHRVSLIKVRNDAYLSELKECDMPEVYAALNALQNTRWRVNRAILGTMKDVWDSQRLSLGGLPSRDSLPLPVPPQRDFDVPKEERTEEQQARIKAWKRAANKVYSENMRLESKRIALSQKLWVAEKFAGFDAIYFPWVLDWRGRAYPVPAALSPQGDDASKALLEFAEGKPLGDNGAYWLAVHGANSFGVDKAAFEDRVKWVMENSDAIGEVASDPIRNRMWIEADSPWVFLAFCKEWLGLQLHVAAGGAQEDFVSHLPVGLDGSCNGLQNFSAMLRDEVGGKATNLVPSDKPSDIYAEVAKVMQRAVEFDAGSGNEQATLWLGKIDRKVAKRPCMTYAYAATQFGMKDQTLAMLKKYEEENDGEQLIDDEHKFAASVYIADVAYRSIGKVVIAAKAAMDWLQSAARIAAQDSLPIRWTTPVGLPVLQNYREIIGEMIEGQIAGKRVRLVYSIEGDKLNKRKQASGIAPNFVHSMDAAHMMRTVNACVEQGLASFAMVHDSYGTHAADVDVMAHTLRRSFVEQYSGDVLGDFRRQLIEQLPEKLAKKIPPLPPMGTLDLTAVESSEYFFA